MKKIDEVNICGEEKQITLHIYQLCGDEYWELDSMNHLELCKEFGVVDECDYDVPFGDLYHSYSFEIHPDYAIMEETTAYNV